MIEWLLVATKDQRFYRSCAADLHFVRRTANKFPKSGRHSTEKSNAS